MFSVRLYLLLSHTLGVSLLPSRRFNPLYAVTPLPPRRPPLVLRHLPCTCGRQRLTFLAASAIGGARKPNPSEGGEGAPAPTHRFNCSGRVCKSALPHQNVRARRALLRFSCTRRVRFIQLCCASYAAGVLHLRRPCRLTAPTYIQSPIRFAGEPDLRVHLQSSCAGGGCSHQRFCRRRYSFRPKFAPESACAPWRFRHCA